MDFLILHVHQICNNSRTVDEQEDKKGSHQLIFLGQNVQTGVPFKKQMLLDPLHLRAPDIDLGTVFLCMLTRFFCPATHIETLTSA